MARVTTIPRVYREQRKSRQTVLSVSTRLEQRNDADHFLNKNEGLIDFNESLMSGSSWLSLAAQGDKMWLCGRLTVVLGVALSRGATLTIFQIISGD